MGYVSTGAISVKGAIDPNKLVQLMADQKCGEGMEWVPPSGGKAGYCRRKTSARGTTATVTETQASPYRERCNKYGFGGEQAKACEAWLEAGKSINQFPSAWACMQRGYTGESFDICLDGRSNQPAATFSEIDAVITELAAQANAQQAAAIAEQQALVAAQKRKRMLIFGGIAAAGVVGFVIWKKKRSKRTPKP